MTGQWVRGLQRGPEAVLGGDRGGLVLMELGAGRAVLLWPCACRPRALRGEAEGEDAGCSGRAKAVGGLCPWTWDPAGWWLCLTACEEHPRLLLPSAFPGLVSESLLKRSRSVWLFPEYWSVVRT